MDLVPVNGVPVHTLAGSRTSTLKVCRHLRCLLSRFAPLSRDERPDGRLLAFAWGDVALRATPIPSITTGLRLFHRPVPAHPSARLAAGVPVRETDGVATLCIC